MFSIVIFIINYIVNLNLLCIFKNLKKFGLHLIINKFYLVFLIHCEKYKSIQKNGKMCFSEK